MGFVASSSDCKGRDFAESSTLCMNVVMVWTPLIVAVCILDTGAASGHVAPRCARPGRHPARPIVPALSGRHPRAMEWLSRSHRPCAEPDCCQGSRTCGGVRPYQAHLTMLQAVEWLAPEISLGKLAFGLNGLGSTSTGVDEMDRDLGR